MNFLKYCFAIALSAPAAAIARRRGGANPLDAIDSYIYVAFAVVIALIVVWRIIDAIRGSSKSRSRRSKATRQRRPDRPGLR